MTVCSDIADYQWLTGDAACGLLDELADSAAPLHAVVSRLRGRLSPQRTHLLVEQVDLRRRAAAKFRQPNRMFFTRLGLEQATDEWIAAYKASRYEKVRASACAMPEVADMCCGIGGDLMALANRGLGVDRDPIAAHFAAVNSGAAARVADIADFDLRDFAAWHVDPDRRASGRRTTSLEFCEPNRAVIERSLEQLPHAAVKLAPATAVPESWAARCELEWISRDRECRQLVAWHGELAAAPGTRRATIVASGDGELQARTVTGPANLTPPLAAGAGPFVFDIDPAVLAAKLKGALAAEHDLSALSAGPTYLTGPLAVDDPALACFEVLAVLPMQRRKLAAYLRERRIGTLEIKKRGVDIQPERLRRELQLRGEDAATLLITPIAGHTQAIVARRHVPTATRPR